MTTRELQSAAPATLPAGMDVEFITIGGVDYQPIIIVDGTTPSQKLAVDSSGRITAIVQDGGSTISIDDGGGSITVDGSFSLGSVSRIQVTPTVSTSPAYSVKDAVGGLLTFANAASSSGGSLRIESVVIVDKASQKADLDLSFFAASITGPTDNAAFDPTDTELLDHVGTVPILGGDYAEFNDNSAATVTAFPLTCTVAATSLYGVLVARGTPTYVSTSDLVVTIQVTRF